MNETFNQRLCRLRKEKGLAASEMARLIGVPPTTYRDWESGRRSKFPPFHKISQVLAISVTELVTGTQAQAFNHIEELRVVEEKLHQIRLNLLAMK